MAERLPRCWLGIGIMEEEKVPGSAEVVAESCPFRKAALSTTCPGGKRYWCKHPEANRRKELKDNGALPWDYPFYNFCDSSVNYPLAETIRQKTK